MKCKTIITVYTASEQIRNLDNQIIKAKNKLEELKNKKNILFFKLKFIKEALNEAKRQHKKLSTAEHEEIADLFGKVMSLKKDSKSVEDQLEQKLDDMSIE